MVTVKQVATFLFHFFGLSCLGTLAYCEFAIRFKVLTKRVFLFKPNVHFLWYELGFSVFGLLYVACLFRIVIIGYLKKQRKRTRLKEEG